MGSVLVWVTFAGAWLLVAGPLYQGSVELNELDVDREGIGGKVVAAQATQDRPSAWWWLLPPLMYVLHRRWYRKLRHLMLRAAHPGPARAADQLPEQDHRVVHGAGGAALLAVGETWQLVEHNDWPWVWVFGSGY